MEAHCWTAGSAAACNARLRLGGLSSRHPIDAFAVDRLSDVNVRPSFLRTTLVKEPAHRVRLPAGRLHDGRDRRAPGLFEQRKDGLLFRATVL